MKNENQFILHKFSGMENDEHETQIIDFQAIDQLKTNALLYPPLLQDSAVLSHLRQELKSAFPIRATDEFSLSAEQFENLNYHDGKMIMQKMTTHWCLKNNLHALENIFAITDHLKALYPNNRTEFFEELWEIFRKNLGATSLTLTYNDLAEGKNKLKQIIIEGNLKGAPRVATEIEEKIFLDYEKFVSPAFEVVEFDSARSELVATLSVKNSPVLIMAKTLMPTTLQKSLLRAIGAGINA
jgi:hypothetical protein